MTALTSAVHSGTRCQSEPSDLYELWQPREVDDGAVKSMVAYSHEPSYTVLVGAGGKGGGVGGSGGEAGGTGASGGGGADGGMLPTHLWMKTRRKQPVTLCMLPELCNSPVPQSVFPCSFCAVPHDEPSASTRQSVPQG